MFRVWRAAKGARPGIAPVRRPANAPFTAPGWISTSQNLINDKKTTGLPGARSRRPQRLPPPEARISTQSMARTGRKRFNHQNATAGTVTG